MDYNLTLLNLLSFTPKNDIEKELFNFDKDSIDVFITELDKGFFYLGGQIKMSHNDIINLNCIEKVREINKKREIEYGGPANIFELISINNHIKRLEYIENMIIKYNEIMKIREKDNLNKNNSNDNI